MTFEDKRDRILDAVCKARHEAEETNNRLTTLHEEKAEAFERLVNERERKASDLDVLQGNDDVLDPLEFDDYDSQKEVDEAARELSDELEDIKAQIQNIRDDNKSSRFDRKIARQHEQLQEAQKTAVRREQRLRTLLSMHSDSPYDFSTEEELEEKSDELIDDHDWEPSEDEGDAGE